MSYMKIKHVSCGCCSNGCVCFNHMDIPRGLKPQLCNYCAALPRHPIDHYYRFDFASQEFVRKPQEKASI